MKDINSVLPLLKLLVEGLGKQFGPDCELLVHDYSRGFGSSIVAIANGGVTGRSVGDGGTDIGLRVYQGESESDGRYNYITQTQDGRYLKSSTIYLKDDEGKVLGSLCVNLDVTKIISCKNLLEGVAGIEASKEKVEATVYKSVDDLLASIINDSVAFVGTPIAMMTREQKIKGIKYIAERGGMKIKNAGSVVARYYGVSKYTVYNYLGIASGKEDMQC